MAKKTPKYLQIQEPTKRPKHIQNPEGYQNQLIAWHFHRMDNGGNWSCNYETLKSISNRLHEYEKLKWNEVTLASGNHPMPTIKIVPQAKTRLFELGIGDTETLYQIEIKGIPKKKPRLWGLRQENIFQILWWDLNHTVYISKNYKK